MKNLSKVKLTTKMNIDKCEDFIRIHNRDFMPFLGAYLVYN